MLPREKFNQRGLRFLTDTDLVCLLLGFGIKGNNVRSVAREVVKLLRKAILYNTKSDWLNVMQKDQLESISGIGRIKAIKIVAALELGRRFFFSHNEKGCVISSRKDIISRMEYMRSFKQEHVVVLMLDARNILIDKMTVAIGAGNKAIVHPRDVFYQALLKNSAKIIIVHNHPSGEKEPSMEDLQFGKRLERAGKLIGIEVLDQVIIG